MAKYHATLEDNNIFNAMTIEQRRAALWTIMEYDVDDADDVHDLLHYVNADLPLPQTGRIPHITIR